MEIRSWKSLMEVSMGVLPWLKEGWDEAEVRRERERGSEMCR
jgi:hypothetical protein